MQFPNADSIYHNAFSVSGQNRFDLGLYRSGASRDKKFEEPGLVRVYCNIHPQMVGFVMVVDSDFAAVTGPDGARSASRACRTAQHVVKAWHEESGESQSPVDRPRAERIAPLAIRLDVTELPARALTRTSTARTTRPARGTDDERY